MVGGEEVTEPYYYKGVRMPGIYRGGAGERGWKRGVDDALKHAEAERFVRAEREGVVDGIRFRRHREEVEALQAEIIRLKNLVNAYSGGYHEDGPIIRNDNPSSTSYGGIDAAVMRQHAVNLIQRDPEDYGDGS